MSALSHLFTARMRGFRLIEIVAGVLLIAMVVSVYVAKAAAAREDQRIAELDRAIARERSEIRLLRAEVSALERPARIEALSRMAGLERVDPARVIDVTDLRPAPALPADAAGEAHDDGEVRP
ncbi:MAG: cell division protein [Brevundimonas sp.]|jgi:hypothetical protein|uniref:cell division protein FtsL n=1 Tax=Brevundimonas sp. TaxID=1871086 RepID=UPI0039195639